MHEHGFVAKGPLYEDCGWVCGVIMQTHAADERVHWEYPGSFWPLSRIKLCDSQFLLQPDFPEGLVIPSRHEHLRTCRDCLRQSNDSAEPPRSWWYNNKPLYVPGWSNGNAWRRRRFASCFSLRPRSHSQPVSDDLI